MSDIAAKRTYEEQKNEVAMALFRQALLFAETDNEINKSFASLMGTMAAYVKENPKAAFDSGKGLEDVLRELKAVRTAAGAGTTGGDTIGGSPISDVIDLIEGIADVLKDEKDFFLQIIKLIFCGC
jgi:hypothetical protein